VSAPPRWFRRPRHYSGHTGQGEEPATLWSDMVVSLGTHQFGSDPLLTGKSPIVNGRAAVALWDLAAEAVLCVCLGVNVSRPRRGSPAGPAGPVP
jgi:hypothetical protein